MKRITRFALAFAALLTAVSTTALAEDPKARLAKAEAMFQERCKKAGEFIHKRAENVEGVFLLKLRPKEINYGDQYRMDDPYGSDLGGDGYIGSFVRGSFDSMRAKEARPGWPLRLGYRYVDAIDPKDGKRYRYTGSVKEVIHTSSILMGGGRQDAVQVQGIRS